jgi:hypothetical protein
MHPITLGLQVDPGEKQIARHFQSNRKNEWMKLPKKKKTGRATKLRFSLVSRKVVELAQHQRFLAFGPSIYSPLIN